MENGELELGMRSGHRTTRGINELILANGMYQTEGIRYAGSKRMIIPFIHERIRDLKIKRVLDGFSGSTRVSQFFKKSGYSVHANDISAYSSIFSETYITNNELDNGTIKEKIDHLNSLSGIDGFYSSSYGGSDDGDGNVISIDGKKKPFLIKNARRIDRVTLNGAS